jgi:hypothetical protein
VEILELPLLRSFLRRLSLIAISSQPPLQSSTGHSTQLNLNSSVISSADPGSSLYSFGAFINHPPILICVFVAEETCLPSRCLAVSVYSGSILPAFRRHVTIYTYVIKMSKCCCGDSHLSRIPYYRQLVSNSFTEIEAIFLVKQLFLQHLRKNNSDMVCM